MKNCAAAHAASAASAATAKAGERQRSAILGARREFSALVLEAVAACAGGLLGSGAHRACARASYGSPAALKGTAGTRRRGVKREEEARETAHRCTTQASREEN